MLVLVTDTDTDALTLAAALGLSYCRVRGHAFLKKIHNVTPDMFHFLQQLGL